MRKRIPWIIVLLFFTVVSCTSIPEYTTPQAIRTVETTTTEDILAPTPGEDPDLLLRDFFTASVYSNQKHQAARAFLTESTAEKWDDTKSIIIVDRIDLNSVLSTQDANANTVSYVVRGNIVGNLGNGGVFTPTSGSLEATFVLKKEKGEWRIDSLPNGVIMENTALYNSYTPHDIFFLDPTEKYLVRDRRWVFNNQSNLDSVLLSLLIDGPKARMRQGLVTQAPEKSTFAGVKDGVYYFTGFSSLSSDARHKFAAQVIWTLARSGISGPYRIDLDGTPLDSENLMLTVDDVAEFNPNAITSGTTALYALRSGQLFNISGSSPDTLTPVLGTLGSSRNIQSIAISGDTAAAIIGNPAQGDQTFVIGSVNGSVNEVLHSKTISRPSFEPSGNAAWVVLDSHNVVSVSRNNNSGEYATVTVDTSALEAVNTEEISVVRLSPSGTQVAFIIGGHVYIATVTRPDAGERSITEVLDVAPSIGNTALDLDWLPDGSILVGTNDPENPLWRVQIDGSAIRKTSAGNITAPVTAVSISPSTMYVTDARAALRMGVANDNNQFWREVPALAGTNGVVIASK